MKTFFKSLPAALLILLFIYAAASKLLTFSAFRQQLYNQTFPHALAGVLLYALPLTELTAAGLLFARRTLLTGLRLSLLLLISFSGYIVLVLLHYWNRVPCSCGGILNRMGWSAHLIFNCFFILVAITAIHYYKTDKKGVAENLRKE